MSPSKAGAIIENLSWSSPSVSLTVFQQTWEYLS